MEAQNLLADFLMVLLLRNRVCVPILWIWASLSDWMTSRVWCKWCCVASKGRTWEVILLPPGSFETLSHHVRIRIWSCHVVRKLRTHVGATCRCSGWLSQLRSLPTASVSHQICEKDASRWNQPLVMSYPQPLNPSCLSTRHGRLHTSHHPSALPNSRPTEYMSIIKWWLYFTKF